MTDGLSINRRSAPISGFESAKSERPLPQPEHRLETRGSEHSRRFDAVPLAQISTHSGPIGKPVSLTLPPPPASRSERTSPLGVESMAEGMEKVTRAKVDVARRGFWRKCLGVAATAAALVLMSVATGGLGAVGMVSLGLTAAFLAKGALDTTVSLMNWRNLKAGFAGQPPPFPFLTRLPGSVRDNAAAALLVGLGMSEKSSIWVSRALDVALGLGSTAAYGFAVGGIASALIAVTPFLVGERLTVLGERLEQRRQFHAQITHSRMSEIAQQTLMALQDLQALQDRVLSEGAPPPPASVELDDGAKPVDSSELALLERAKLLQADARDMMKALQTRLQDRVLEKAAGKLNGTAAGLLDGTSESASYTADLVVGTPMPFIMVGTLMGRAVIEMARTARSGWRDEDKLQQFADQHRGLRREIGLLTYELRAQIEELENQRSDVMTSIDDAASLREGPPHERPPLPGDRRYS